MLGRLYGLSFARLSIIKFCTWNVSITTFLEALCKLHSADSFERYFLNLVSQNSGVRSVLLTVTSFQVFLGLSCSEELAKIWAVSVWSASGDWLHLQESELRQKLADAEADASQSKGGHKRLRERCDAAEGAAEAAHRALRTAKEEAAAAAQVPPFYNSNLSAVLLSCCTLPNPDPDPDSDSVTVYSC